MSSERAALAPERFVLSDGTIYLDGNSLGAMPVGVPAAVEDALHRQWAADLITSWNDNGWWQLPARIGDRIGALVGAGPGQVICGDSTSVQLFQTLVAAARLRPGRTVLITDGGGFPTDQYLTDSVARLLDLEVVRIHPSELARHLDARTAAVSFSLVDYRTGELFDLAGVTAATHAAGAVMVWDLCHAAGALPVRLDEAGVDLAVGCSYKYLNGGPGAPAWIYVAAGLQAEIDLPLTGWHGHRSPFALEQHYAPAASIEQARIGTPPLLSMLALDAALDAFDGIELSAVRAASLALTDQVIAYADEQLTRYDVEVVTPRAASRRGSHVSLRMPSAYEVCQALIARGVIGDYRAPDMLRLGLTPLYLSGQDVDRAMAELRDVLETKAYQAVEFARSSDHPVT
ncbi:aminotransferase class V-fold PLP-dependent enzyme [Jatrophihabitans telluris]|uniref:Kynureninase n=1 Tax=Jatrophihabitans telluris TaxID=2038343 RepID=A0ABY4R0Q5_9ACTN|nr:aminotransferase class V-fold PLP-dependent enzyme [Jatrophihabitans telluris]UQX89339.1 aminotransferase class V-fold PLP-dependent enzyme [Jatrophihabitans telluris]